MPRSSIQATLATCLELRAFAGRTTTMKFLRSEPTPVWARLGTRNSMSKKTKKPRTSRRAATAEKSKSTVQAAESTQVTNGAAHPAPSADSTARTSFVPPLQSLIPTTDDIDDDWGGDNSEAESDVGSEEPREEPSKPNTPALAGRNSEAPKPSATFGSSRVSASKPAVSAKSDLAPKSASPARSISSKGFAPTPVPPKTSPHSEAPGSSRPAPPSSRSVMPTGIATGRPSAAPRPSSAPFAPSSRSVTPPAGMRAARPSQAPASSAHEKPQSSSTPPVVRAVILPPLAAIPKGEDRSRTPEDAVPGRELERDLKPVPVPSAASKVLVDLPQAPMLELSEVGSASEQRPPPLPLEEDELVSASSRDSEIPKPAVDEASAELSERYLRPETFALPIVAPVVSAEEALIGTAAKPAQASEVVTSPSSSSRAPARKSSRIWLLVALWIVSAAVPALVVWQAMRAQNARCLAANVTNSQYAARAAVNVTPTHHPESLNRANATPSASDPAGSASASATTSAEPPTDSSSSTGSADPVAEPSAPPLSPSADATSTAAAFASTAVVVETDSADRVSVLLHSKPDNAKVLRRGKEIGRTPLTIQIGRGEHRIFEVAAHGFGAKRVTINGDKPEILVNMLSEKPPPTKFVPATFPDRKYERLQ